jgi:hypothetical protein
MGTWGYYAFRMQYNYLTTHRYDNNGLTPLEVLCSMELKCYVVEMVSC